MSFKPCCLVTIAFFSGLFALPIHTQAGTNNPNYRLVNTFPLEGPIRWDYLVFDPDGLRLFITRGERVDVFDVSSKKITGAIKATKGVHGIALAPGLNRGFTSDGAANTSTIFDLATLQTITTVPTGTKPDAIVYDPATHRVFTANGGSADMTAIAAKDGKILATIKLGGKPEFIAADGQGLLYVNIEDTAQLAVVDTKELKVLARHNLAPNCQGPTGLSMDTLQDRLFVSCHNRVMLIVDGKKGKIIDTLPIGASSDATIFDPVTQLAFSANGEGTLTVIGASDAEHYTVLQTVKTLPTARTMALNPLTHEIYLVAAEMEGFDPPTEKRPYPRPRLKPDTFMILTVAPGTIN